MVALLKTVNICKDGTPLTKQNTPSSQLKQSFISHMRKHVDTKQIFTDGSKSPEGVGFGVVHGRNYQNRIRGTLPREASVYTAELHAILKALKLIEESTFKKWTIFSDSQSSIQAITQQNPKHPILRNIQMTLKCIQTQEKEISF